MQRHNFYPDPRQYFWCESRGRAVARGADHAQFAGHFEIPAQIIKIGVHHAAYVFVFAAVARDGHA